MRSWKFTPDIKVPRDIEEFMDEVAMTIANVVAQDSDKNALATLQFNMYTDKDFDNRDFSDAVRFAMEMLEIELSARTNSSPRRAVEATANLAVSMLRAALIDEFPELEREVSEAVRREAIYAVRQYQRMIATIEDFQKEDRRDLRDDRRERSYRDDDDRDYRDRPRRVVRERDDDRDRSSTGSSWRNRGRDDDRDRPASGRIGWRDSRGRTQGAVRQYDTEDPKPGWGSEEYDCGNPDRFRAQQTERQGGALYDRRTRRGGIGDCQRPSHRDEPAEPAQRPSVHSARISAYMDDVAPPAPPPPPARQEPEQDSRTSQERANDVMRQGGQAMRQARDAAVQNQREEERARLSSERKLRSWEPPEIETVTGETEMQFMEHNSIYEPTNQQPEPMAAQYKELLDLAQALQFDGLIEESQIEKLIDVQTPGKMAQDVDLHTAVDTVLADSIKMAVSKIVDGKDTRRIYRAGIIVSNPFVGRESLNGVQGRIRRSTSMTDLHRHMNEIAAGIKNLGALDPVASDVRAAVDFVDRYITAEYNRYMTTVMGLSEPGTVVMKSWLSDFGDLVDGIAKNFHQRQVSNIAAFTNNLFKAFNEMINTELKADTNVHELLGVDKDNIGIISLPRPYYFTVIPFTGRELGYGTFKPCSIPPNKAPFLRSLILNRDKVEELTGCTQAVQVFVTRDRQAFEMYRDPLNADNYIVSPIAL